MNHLANSTSHLDMPSFNSSELVDCIKELVKLDRSWIDWNNEPDQF